MSDFFTKKQRKYWCENCRIFIEYTKICIEQHNKSKNHLRSINADKSYHLQKNKIMKHIAYNYEVDDIPNYQNEYNSANYLRHKTDRNSVTSNEEFDYSNGYKSINANRGGYATESSLLLEEIKNEKMKEMIKEKLVLKPKQKEWGVFWDNTHNLPYYYNYITNTSQWEKPENFDGIVVKEEQIDVIVPDAIIHKEVSIGKWEEVKKEDSFSEKNKVKVKSNTNIPGEILKKEFYMSEYGIECSESEDEEFDLNAEALKSKTNNNNKINPIDRYIEGSENTQQEDNQTENLINNKDELTEFNKQLKRIDFDLIEVNELYNQSTMSKELNLSDTKEIDNLNSEASNKNKFCISFNKVRKNEKKISSIFQRSVDDD